MTRLQSLIIGIVGSAVPVGILMTTPAIAQTAPCGRMILLANEESGSPTEVRFIAAPPEHVEASALKALPAVGARLKQKDGLVLRAQSDGSKGGFNLGLWGAWYTLNKQAGIKGNTAGTTRGEWTVELRPETRDGVTGTNVKINFDKGIGSTYGKNGATPLMGEIECLSGLLSRADPLVNPRGPGGTDGAAAGSTVTLAEGTPLNVILRDPWFSKDVAKTASQAQLVFEVAANVDVEGVTLVRKGALAVGRFTQVKAASGGGKAGSIGFVIDHVTAVDGQSVSVKGAGESLKGQGVNTSGYPNAVMGVTGGAVGGAGGALAVLLQKGYDVLLRAGTAFDVEVSGNYSVKVAK